MFLSLSGNTGISTFVVISRCFKLALYILEKLQATVNEPPITAVLSVNVFD
jgi:hypothetical protein